MLSVVISQFVARLQKGLESETGRSGPGGFSNVHRYQTCLNMFCLLLKYDKMLIQICGHLHTFTYLAL